MNNLEIEKKFLLKMLPSLEWTSILKIEQYYIKRTNYWERYRRSINNLTGEILYKKTIKQSLSKNSIIRIEKEDSISKEIYEDAVKECYLPNTEARYISKVRYIIPYNNELKWEIDVFSDLNIVIAELEIPKVRYKVIMPDFIKELLLLDVTKLKQFSSRSLAKKIKP